MIHIMKCLLGAIDAIEVALQRPTWRSPYTGATDNILGLCRYFGIHLPHSELIHGSPTEWCMVPTGGLNPLAASTERLPDRMVDWYHFRLGGLSLCMRLWLDSIWKSVRRREPWASESTLCLMRSLDRSTVPPLQKTYEDYGDRQAITYFFAGSRYYLGDTVSACGFTDWLVIHCHRVFTLDSCSPW